MEHMQKLHLQLLRTTIDCNYNFKSDKKHLFIEHSSYYVLILLTTVSKGVIYIKFQGENNTHQLQCIQQ